ncbi:M10 family metallopeptidase C-terminal domain-containing protein [Pseudomonas lactis]|uniref:M10 family metallopeptidase C-terminal domain-containing protein n=1 Tax=Pseudomonas lactis TaxID=1615674 RepID=UPI001474DBB3|nr:M10 family metallopeptidase C-terminal domain-containing protein [Pseudomonas lactis]NNA49943.1 alkaline protease [Pseudomonas lactis]
MINAPASAANYHMPTPNVTPQPSPLAHPGNPGDSDAVKSSHADANSAADNQASTGSKLLNLSAPLVGDRTGLQRLYGSSLNSGLLQLGEVNSGKVVIARCSPKAEEDTKPAADEPKPNGDTKPVTDKPKPSGFSTPVTDRPKPRGGTKQPVVEQPKPEGTKQPVVEQPKPEGTKQPVVEQPKPEGTKQPVVEQPKPEGTKQPVVDQPKPEGTKQPVVDQPKPEGTKQPVVDRPRPGGDPRTDDTTYGFNSNTGKRETTLTSASDKPEFNIWDERGNDTFDFSGFKQDQIINLRGGAFSSVGGMRENVRIGEKTVIENAVGGHGNDRIIGNSADNVLTGGAGADTLVGGGGWNTFKFNAFSDSTRANADLLLDFNTGQDKIDLSQMALDGKVSLNFVDNYTGKAGDTIIKFNPLSGRYLLAIDLDGDGKTDFLIKSTRMISPEDVIGLNIKDGGYL